MSDNVLYRFYSATGQLLYVGITMDPPGRFRSHKESKAWWEQVSGIAVETYSDRQELAQAEGRAIRVEHPRYNVVHNGGRMHEDLDELPGGWKNPAGIVEFDDADLAGLDSWQQVAQAMNNLFMDAGRSGARVFRGDTFNQEVHGEFIDAMGRLARSICYMDICPECPETAWAAPHKASVPGGSMCAYYRCGEGHEWFRWHTLRNVFREQLFTVGASRVEEF